MRAKTRVLDIASIEIKLNSGAPLMDIGHAKIASSRIPAFVQRYQVDPIP